MARVAAKAGEHCALSDYLNAGVLVRCVPRAWVDEVLANHQRVSVRERALPSYLVVYYVIALGLHLGVAYEEVLRSFLEGWRWLRREPVALKVASKGAISQARERLGWEVMADLAARCLQPLADPSTPGAFFAGLRLVSLDGSTLETADESRNARDFGYPRGMHGAAAFPQLRFVGLLESGTHAWLSVAVDAYSVSEMVLARRLLCKLGPSQLCLADRGYTGYPLYRDARATGAALLWRVRVDQRFPVVNRHPDGSYDSVYRADRRSAREGHGDLEVRVITFDVRSAGKKAQHYRLITTLRPEQASAGELAALYHERWEIETTLDELKTHLKGPRAALRSKTPELVKQEFYGLILAHYAIRKLMFEAARSTDLDTDQLSFTGAACTLRRRMPLSGASPPRAPGS